MKIIYNFLLLFLIFSTIDANPMASIIRKGTRAPVHIATATFLSFRFLLCLEFPVRHYRVTNLFVTEGWQDLKHWRYDDQYMSSIVALMIGRGHRINMAVVKTAWEFNFGYLMSRITRLMRPRYQYCHILYPVRTYDLDKFTRLRNYQPSTHPAKVLGEKKDLIIKVRFMSNDNIRFCTFDAGTPAFCWYGFIGLLAWPMDCNSPTKRCYTKCITIPKNEIYSLTYWNIYSSAASQLFWTFKGCNRGKCNNI